MYRLILFFAGLFVLSAQTGQEWLNRGVQAFKNAQYADAVAAFERAVDANPGNVVAHLYLGTTHMQQYIPGAESPENEAHADRAIAEFRNVLQIEPANKVALSSLASLALNRKRWAEARDWYGRVLAVDPNTKEAYYSIAFTIWGEWYPAYSNMRKSLGLRPEQPGPIGDAAVRDRLRAEWWGRIDEAIRNLQQALALDPEYSDAMAYLNLFIRERADLVGTVTEYQAAIAEADGWVQKALAAKKKQAESRSGMFAAPPPPPPPPSAPQVFRSGSAHMGQLVRKVDPVYPPAAKSAGIQGTVKFEAIIGKDGTITNLQVLSGHPLLVPAALDAVKQWQYQPTLLNGEPVELRTQIDVNFALPK